jgi:hypothetical protein
MIWIYSLYLTLLCLCRGNGILLLGACMPGVGLVGVPGLDLILDEGLAWVAGVGIRRPLAHA